MAPVVVSIDAGLGVLNLAVAPLVGTGWRVQLKRRRTEVMTASGPPLSEIGLRQEFRLSTPEWIKANLALDGKESAWDAYITNVERPVSPIRLQWGGSSSTKPRETVRFRYTSSWAVIGEVIQMRPYWTLDQHLAVALVRLKNDEGTHL